MPESPNIYLDDPDPLSTLLTRLELNAEVYVNGAFCGRWAVDTAGSRRIPFHLIGNGEAWLHFEDNSPKRLGVQDLVVFPHDSHHIISSTDDKPEQENVNLPMTNDGDVTQMICGFFEFRNPAVFPLLDAMPNVVFLPGMHEASSRRTGALIEMMLMELDEGQLGNYAAINQIAFLLFIEVLRWQVLNGDLSDGLLTALFDTRIGRALNAMHEHAEHSWTLDTLAERAAMSRSSFAERFTQLVGITPMKYLTGWRMTEARRLLATTTLSTAQVAEKSGYESEAAFRKAFKSTLGETPGAVRAASRK